MKEENIVFTLNNGKKYAVIQKLNMDSEEYLWLTNIDDIKDTNIYKLKENKLEKVLDEELIKKIIVEISNHNNDNN